MRDLVVCTTPLGNTKGKGKDRREKLRKNPSRIGKERYITPLGNSTIAKKNSRTKNE